MRTLGVCALFLMFAIASSVMGPPIVNRSGYFYNIDPRKNFLRVSRPFHSILKDQKPQICGDSTRVFGVHGYKNHQRVSSKPVHPNVKPQRPEIEGASPRIFGLHDHKYLAANSDTPAILVVAYFITVGCVICGLCVFCTPFFFILKKFVSRIFTGAPEPQRRLEEIMIQHM